MSGLEGGLTLPPLAPLVYSGLQLPQSNVSVEGKQISVTFDNVDEPTTRDKITILHPDVAKFFEIKGGKIVHKYAPIRDRIANPIGRTDYGWNDEKRREHLRSAYSRGWKEFTWRPTAHNGTAIIVGGGPSLKKNIQKLRYLSQKRGHYIITTNKTHDFLLNLDKHGLGAPIKPWGALLLDPCDWVKDYITPIEGVQYLIGDQCAPDTFKVFEKPGISRWVFRSTNPTKDQDIVPQNMLMVFGGSTGGMRCRTIMYFSGFRKMLYFGFDSSCDENDKLHGYEKWDSVKDRTKVKIVDERGFEREFITNTHMARQAQEWLETRDSWIELVRAGKFEWVDEIFYGDGLLPTLAARLGQHADNRRNQPKDQTLTPGETKNVG